MSFMIIVQALPVRIWHWCFYDCHRCW